MGKLSGNYVSYIDKNGNTQKGIAYHCDQLPAIQAVKKVAVKLLNDDFTPKVNEQGKKLVTLKSPDKLTIIGFSD